MAGLNMKLVNTMSKPKTLPEVTKKVHEQLKTCWREAVRAFILETIKHIPVDTGMSMASLYGVAANSTIRIGNVMWAELLGKGPNKPKKTYVTLEGQVKHGEYKSKELGQTLGKDSKAYDIQFGTPANPSMVFQFKIVVFQYKLRENGFADNQPWDSIAYGKAAFIEEWQKQSSARINATTLLNMIFPRGRITKR
jgi:hypothetical protein